jgi:hypothetical protein
MIFCGASEDEKEVLMNLIRESAASIRSQLEAGGDQ